MSRGGSPGRSRAAGKGGRDSRGRGGPAGREVQVMAGVLFFTAGTTVLYWVLYFTTGAVQAETSEVYKMVFEALINVWTLGLGALLIPFLWKRRHLFREWEGQSAAGRRRP
ncbi:MAG: hypothetical protein H5U04_03640 [Firmicutes bacterium]|nr:hypothetical protein [Bacillota bacterium]